MPEVLRVVVMDLKTTMMHMRRGVRAHEERMMVHRRIPAIDVREDSHIFRLLLLTIPVILARRNVQEIRRREIEIPHIPLQLRREIFHAQAVVAQFVHSSRSRSKAVEFPHARLVVALVVVDDFLRVVVLGSGLDPMHKRHGETFGIVQSNDPTPTR